MTFQFDTSGVIQVLRGEHLQGYDWNSLDPFTQGYIQAMAADFAADQKHPVVHEFGFSEIASSTLARIMEDCATRKEMLAAAFYAATDIAGAKFWENRQRGHGGQGFPPLTVALNEAGQVVFSDSTQHTA